jgi:hypothetical protein
MTGLGPSTSHPLRCLADHFSGYHHRFSNSRLTDEIPFDEAAKCTNLLLPLCLGLPFTPIPHKSSQTIPERNRAHRSLILLTSMTNEAMPAERMFLAIVRLSAHLPTTNTTKESGRIAGRG